MNVKLSVIYVYYATPTEIIQSIQSLKKAVADLSYEVIIIDNASPLPLPEQIQSDKKLHIIQNTENKGYGPALNQGAQIARGDYLALVNPDTLFLKNSLNLMIEALELDTSIGIIGPQFLNDKKQVSQTGNGFPMIPEALFAFSFLRKIFPHNRYVKRYFLTDFDRTKETEIPVICGACMLIKKLTFEKIQGFDEQFFLYFEESDLCYKVKKTGLRILYYPKAQVIHLGGKSSSNKKFIQRNFEKSRYKFFKKYHDPISSFLAESFLRVINRLSAWLP